MSKCRCTLSLATLALVSNFSFAAAHIGGGFHYSQLSVNDKADDNFSSELGTFFYGGAEFASNTALEIRHTDWNFSEIREELNIYYTEKLDYGTGIGLRLRFPVGDSIALTTSYGFQLVKFEQRLIPLLDMLDDQRDSSRQQGAYLSLGFSARVTKNVEILAELHKSSAVYDMLGFYLGGAYYFDNKNAAPQAPDNFYVSAAIGQSTLRNFSGLRNTLHSELAEELVGNEDFILRFNNSTRDISLDFALGLSLNNYVDAEVGILRLGSFEHAVRDAVTTFGITELNKKIYELDLSGLYVGSKLRVIEQGPWGIYGNVGVVNWFDKLTTYDLVTNEKQSRELNHLSAFYGLGASYHISSSMSVYAQWNRYRYRLINASSTDIDRYAVGIEFYPSGKRKMASQEHRTESRGVACSSAHRHLFYDCNEDDEITTEQL